MRRDSQRSGFTLVEVMIALVVLAILGFTVSARVGDIVSQTYSIERRSVAHWVASNHLNRLQMERRVTREPVSTGRSRERVLMAGREWSLEVEIEDTSVETFKRVEIDVFEVQEGDDIGPIEHMTAFLGQH